MLAKDGLGVVVVFFVAFFISIGLWLILPHPVLLIISSIIGLISVFNLFFFRDPERASPTNPMAVLSPADGKVLQIIKVTEETYLNLEVQRISIFLSIFNVHVNRSPISGKVDYCIHHPGKFLAAFNHKASLDNEHTAIGVIHQAGYRVLYKQIAGLIARRIVCHSRVGEWTKSGERIGMIRYGSRVDIFLPFEAKIQIKKGQKVRAGETILAVFSEHSSQNPEGTQLYKKSDSQVSSSTAH